MIICLEDVIWEDLYFCGLESDIQLAMKRWKVSSCQQLQLTCVRFSDLPFFIFYSRNAWKSFKPLTLYRYFYLLFSFLLSFFFLISIYHKTIFVTVKLALRRPLKPVGTVCSALANILTKLIKLIEMVKVVKIVKIVEPMHWSW